MDLFRYIVRFLYKIRWYLVILPLIALVVAWFMTRNMDRVYDTNTTIYTGMITGYNIEGGVGAAGGNSQTNITNLMLMGLPLQYSLMAIPQKRLLQKEFRLSEKGKQTS